MQILREYKKIRTIWTLTIVSVVLLNFTILPCVHAFSFNQEINHECPHCLAPEKSSCHSSDDCSDCAAELNTLKVKEYKIGLEDNQNLTALLSWYEKDITIHSNYAERRLSASESNYISPPIYLKNCAFLN